MRNEETHKEVLSLLISLRYVKILRTNIYFFKKVRIMISPRLIIKKSINTTK